MKTINYNEICNTRLEVGDVIHMNDLAYIVREVTIESSHNAVPIIKYEADLYPDRFISPTFLDLGHYFHEDIPSSPEIINRSISISTPYTRRQNATKQFEIQEEHNIDEWTDLLYD